jgi:GNAT superfamily N-acetyltransferase
VAEYYKELAERFEGGFDPASKAYAGPETSTTYFALVQTDGEPVGCASLVWSDKTVGEIKRMWVSPSARGQGIAKRLLEHIESVARTEGLAAIRLDTNKALTEAHALYRHAGYRDIPRYNDNLYAHHWFGKEL